jgi:hypothetical protein
MRSAPLRQSLCRGPEPDAPRHNLGQTDGSIREATAPRRASWYVAIAKDHRPDLRQLVCELSATRDGAIFVLFRVHDGNRADDTPPGGQSLISSNQDFF